MKVIRPHNKVLRFLPLSLQTHLHRSQHADTIINSSCILKWYVKTDHVDVDIYCFIMLLLPPAYQDIDRGDYSV